MPRPVIVEAPDREGGRRVWCDGEALGRASSLYDVMDLLHGAGLGAAAIAFENTDIFDWRGGGPYAWTPAPPAAAPAAPPDAPDGPADG